MFGTLYTTGMSEKWCKKGNIMHFRFWSWGKNISILAFCFFLSRPVGVYAEPSLKLGIHPYLSSTEIVRRFTPLAEYLSRELNRRVTIEIASSYATHIDNIGTDSLDIALLGPASYVLMTRKYGGRPLLAVFESNGTKTFRGAIIAKKDSPITSLSQLKGKKFAFGDKASTMGHLVPRYMLLKKGVAVSDLAGHAFLSNQENVCLGVLTGDFDAAAVKEEVFREYEHKGLKAIAFTPEINDHVFVASAKLPQETVRSLRKAFMSLNDRPEGKQILSTIQKNLGALAPAKDSEYDNLREILQVLQKAGVEP
jgi:phosphonate transport system substrate-binding protein